MFLSFTFIIRNEGYFLDSWVKDVDHIHYLLFAGYQVASIWELLLAKEITLLFIFTLTIRNEGILNSNSFKEGKIYISKCL